MEDILGIGPIVGNSRSSHDFCLAAGGEVAFLRHGRGRIAATYALEPSEKRVTSSAAATTSPDS